MTFQWVGVYFNQECGNYLINIQKIDRKSKERKKYLKQKNGRLQTLSCGANKSSADHVSITNKSEGKIRNCRYSMVDKSTVKNKL